MARKLVYLGLGVLFGFTLSRVGASDYNLIYAMFTGEDLKLAMVIGTAIVTAAIGMRIIALTGNKGYNGQKITVNKKPLNKYSAYGGVLFGVGWAMSGACPGTVLAQVGEGKVLGLFTMLGIVTGTYIYALIAENKPTI
jgi:hypothetical protein